MNDVSRDWLERNFPCKAACPVHTEAGKYVTLIAQGNFREAYAVARRPNPLASICGRICAAPCEAVCRRGELDAPIAIRALKRFVTERFGVESMMDFSVLTAIYGHRADRYAERVAVVGSGPAGLACAHDLALMGYPVTIFEAAPVAGGMLRLGVPEYRLPRALIQLEVNAILSLGVELKTGVRLGRDFTLSDLRAQGFSAIFLGVGAMQSRSLSIPGMDLDGVLKGIDYLLNVNLGYKVEMGARVVVIGGGNVALDVARTAARSGVEENLERNLSVVQALDVARSAVRFGAREVVVCCLESESEMPAAKDEVEEARREGIHFRYRLGPKRLVGEGGVVTGVEFLDVSRVFDETGRFSPQFVEGSEIRPSDRHRPRRDRADRGLHVSEARGRDRDARRTDHDRRRDARDQRPRNLRGRRRGLRPAHRDQRDRRRQARRPLDRRLLPGPRPPVARGRGHNRRPRPLRAGSRLRGHSAPGAADPPDLAAHRHRRGRGVLRGGRGTARGNALPPLLDEHDLRGERRGRDRVRSLRRLPGHLSGGLHRDRRLRSA